MRQLFKYVIVAVGHVPKLRLNTVLAVAGNLSTTSPEKNPPPLMIAFIPKIQTVGLVREGTPFACSEVPAAIAG